MEPTSAPPSVRDKILLRLPRRSCSLPRRLFFHGGPALLIPLLDRLFLALRRPLDRLLPTPACFAQQPSHMIAVITHPKAPIDNLGHAPSCPDITAKAIG